MLHDILYSLPHQDQKKWKLGHVNKSATSFECANLIENSSNFFLFITNNMQESIRLKNEIQQFTKKNVFIFSDWDTLPFDYLSPHKNIISSRMSVLSKLFNITQGLLIISINSIIQKLCPREYLLNEEFLIEKNMLLSYNELLKILKNKHYSKVDQIILPGEYSYRTDFIEFYAMGISLPCRLKFLNNKIFNISIFDINTQKIVKNVDSITLMPVHEFPNTKYSIDIFCKKWKENFNSTLNNTIYYQVKNRELPPGIEYWQPFFFKNNLETIFHYLPKTTTIIYKKNIKKNIFFFWKKINKRYHHIFSKLMQPLVQPNKLWMNPDSFFYKLSQWSNIEINKKKISDHKNHINLLYYELPNLNIQYNHKLDISKLIFFLKSFSGKIIFCMKNQYQYKILSENLRLYKKVPIKINSIYMFNYLKKNVKKNEYFLMIGRYENGFLDMQRNIAFICDNDLQLKYNIDSNTLIKKNDHNTNITINDLSNIEINQAIVHFEHGIGRYKGLTTITVSGIQSEYIVLEYADKAKLYVPMTSLSLINKYIGFLKSNIPLHKLGSDNWNKEKQKAIKKIYDIAIILLDLYSYRKSQTGFSFKIDMINYQLFCNDFPFIMTYDQQLAINAVLCDMKNNLPMDRLVCGDVGFGKTEIAMRAAFIAVSNNKQVVVLVPTTILAQQHFYNFKKRFINFSFKIDILSRFCNVKKQSISFKNMQDGKTNILIGTHLLLIKKIKWYDLGLLIIDEEHRFGVCHKESIKSHFLNIDILTLTATPIPRTLNMAMTGIRDLSIITTPPDKRLTIKTFIREYDNTLIRDAIMKELLRGGQVYYVYNNVKKIKNKSEMLFKLIPEAKIGIGHGQMHSKDLAQVINNFLHKKYDVLVCSTIIETGIDIPNANTIIIEKADYFGLAQLHQLRGRVGRSCHQAYAWLLVSNFQTLTVDAKKRLEAISKLEKFGAGLTLSTHDLEIRGIGEILGKNQSGHVGNIGYSLYMKLLDNAIVNIKNNTQLSLENIIKSQPEIELHISAFIPELYIYNVNIRLSFYKKIVTACDIKTLKNIKLELIDRFGRMPCVTKHLIIFSKIRIFSEKLGIKKIRSNDKEVLIQFLETNNIDIKELLKILNLEENIWKFEHSHCLKFIYHFASDIIRIKWILQFLKKIYTSTI